MKTALCDPRNHNGGIRRSHNVGSSGKVECNLKRRSVPLPEAKDDAKATPCTPGRESSFSPRRSQNLIESSGLGYDDVGRRRSAVNNPSRSYPRGAVVRRIKLWISRPAATRTIKERAISATTRLRLVRWLVATRNRGTQQNRDFET